MEGKKIYNNEGLLLLETLTSAQTTSQVRGLQTMFLHTDMRGIRDTPHPRLEGLSLINKRISAKTQKEAQ